MRKLIMWNLITLDGCFEGPQSWDLGFHEHAWGDELKRFSLEQGREVGALLFGRVTYDGMAAHWTSASGEIADFMTCRPRRAAQDAGQRVRGVGTRADGQGRPSWSKRRRGACGDTALNSSTIDRHHVFAWAAKYLGQSSSPAKARAARINGRQGGRPRGRNTSGR